MSLLWLFAGSGGSDKSKTGSGSLKGGDLWSWAQSFEHGEAEKSSGWKGSGIDWAARREKVRDAFMVSWDGYAKYGWGKCLILSFQAIFAPKVY